MCDQINEKSKTAHMSFLFIGNIIYNDEQPNKNPYYNLEVKMQ